MDNDPSQLAALVNGSAGAINGVRPPNANIPSYNDIDIATAISGGDKAMGMARLLSRNDNFSKQKDQFIAAQRQQAIQQADPMFQAQQFYSQSGNLAAAIQIGKSKGSALFQLGQEVNLGSFGSFAIGPKGSVMEEGPQGSMAVPARYSAARRGVMVVPFTGGDENADAFRASLADTQRIMGLLDRLDTLYGESGYIGRASPTVRSAEAEAIESQLVTGVLKTLNGTKSMAGVSEGEMNMIMGSIPRSASTWLTNGRGNERVKLGKLRNDLTNLLLRAADSNGIELVPIRRQPTPTREGGGSAIPSGVSL